MKKLVVLLVCSQIMKIGVSSQINTKVIEGVNFYKVSYSLVDRKLKSSKNVEEQSEIEFGILLEDIEQKGFCAEDSDRVYKCCLDYYPIKVAKNLYNLERKHSFLKITDQFKLLWFGGGASFIGFHLNNFRYGLSFNVDRNFKMLDFNLGTTWVAKLLNNEWVYAADSLNTGLCYENLWVEYKVSDVQYDDSKVKRYTIGWKGLRSYLGSLYRWDRYSKRHGTIIIDSNGILHQFEIYSPNLMQVFTYYYFNDNKEKENCLKIVKIAQEEFDYLRSKIRL